MRKPLIDWNTCIGCGLCVVLCSAVFELKDDGKAWVYGMDRCGTCNCQKAIDACPTDAIHWSE